MGNLTLEMSTQDEVIRVRVEHFFQEGLRYFERALDEAEEHCQLPASVCELPAGKHLIAKRPDWRGAGEPKVAPQQVEVGSIDYVVAREVCSIVVSWVCH